MADAAETEKIVEAIDWEAKYKGLQRTLDAVQGKLTASEEKARDFEGKYGKAMTDSERLAAELKTKGEEAMSHLTGLTSTKAEYTRFRWLAENAPDLMEFEKDGLLPAVGVDKLPEVVEKFRAKLGKGKEEATKEGAKKTAEALLEGQTPPPPPKDTPATIEQMRTQMFAAFKAGNTEEYDGLRAKIFAAEAKTAVPGSA
jgi:hypothetical protein